MSGKKIFSFLMIAAVTVLIVSSVSFSTESGDVSGSFVVRAETLKDVSYDNVVKIVANIEVEALTGSIASYVEEGIDRASKDIYEANVFAREEAKRKAEEEAAREAAKRQAEEEAVAESKAASGNAVASGPVSLSGLEAEMLNLINQTRADHGLSMLAPSQMLIDLARSRSSDMISRNYFSHYTPDGQNIKHIFARYGVSYRNFGENLGNASPASYGSPGAFLNAWMNSPSHRDNMLKGYYTTIGVGVVDGGGRRVVTVLFIR